MTASGEGLPGRKHEIGRIKDHFTLKLKPLDAGQHYAVTGIADHAVVNQCFGNCIRCSAVALVMPAGVGFQQRPGNQHVAICSVVFVGDRVGLCGVIAPVKQTIFFVLQLTVCPLPELIERGFIVVSHRHQHGKTLTFRMRHAAITGINNAAFRFEKAGLVTLPGPIRMRERRKQHTHHDGQRCADGFSHN